MLAAGHDVLVARGYHGTRVDDITQAAKVSHGAFYRYFDNKDHLIRLLAVRAIRTVSVAMADIPDAGGSGAGGGLAGGPAASGKTLPVMNPATGEPVGKVAHAERSDLDRALAAAKKGFNVWHKLSA